MKLRYEKGTVRLDGEYNLPHGKWDGREGGGSQRALGFRYGDIVEYLDKSSFDYEDEVLDLIPCPDLSCDVELRDYQEESFKRWMINRSGIIVLPTGSGKTYLGMKVIEEVNAPAFIVVPTLDLVDQWIEELQRFDVDIGEYTGREKNLEAVTVSTYDSAYLHAEEIGNKFKLLICDEVHHLAAESYRHIAEFFASPFRLGLTATYEREDGKHKGLQELMGGKVFELKTEELAGEHLADYTVERIRVDLRGDEKREYRKKLKIFQDYLRSTNIKMRGPQDFRKVVMRSGNDPRAWKAVRARNEARQIAYNSSAKLDVLENILGERKNDRIIIFTRHNEMVYEVSKRFLIPCITHKTGKKERKEILRRFKNGTYSAVVSSQVLDEGVDVPAANVGVILSGTGSTREYRQRLGRILRPSGGDARLYEVVSSGTKEIQTSYRRKKK
ncbi:MAG: DEAD/DEAH box helicase family protein [Candidatus Saliniplasma sp.]